MGRRAFCSMWEHGLSCFFFHHGFWAGGYTPKKREAEENNAWHFCVGRELEAVIFTNLGFGGGW